MRLAHLALVIGCSFAASCVSVEFDANEDRDNLPRLDGPTIEFDPGNRIIPFPNNLLLDPATGIVTLPEGCNESATSAALRTGVLNALNGFGTFKSALSVTFTEAVDPASLTDNVKLYKIASAGAPTDPTSATPVPVVVIPGMTSRSSADCTSTVAVDNAVFVPLIPLDGDSTYAVALTGNITTADGAAFLPSSTWALIRGAENPVTLDDDGNIIADQTPLDPFNPDDRATLIGVDLLWNAHAGPLAFLAATGLDRGDIHLAWSFNTQATTRATDPASAGSLASAIVPTPLLGGTSILGAATPSQFIDGVLGLGACTVLPCAAVADIVGAGFLAQNYQTPTANPLGGTPVPGPWSDPITPVQIDDEVIGVLVFVPNTPVPTAGWPTIIFGHGLTRSRNDLFAIGSQLAAAGFLAVSIDWVDHGTRAVQISDSAAAGCDDVSAGPTALPQCFAPILSTNLAGTRDNLRQSVLNTLALIEGLKACGAAGCNAIQVDASRIGYMGQSLGSIIGTMIVSMSPDIRAAVLNVGGIGLIDIVENTDSLGIRCSIVNGLIQAGIIAGEVNVTCRTEEWKLDPGYRRFAVIGRWTLDPGDPANYLPGLAGKAILMQEVIDDEVVPNFATDQQGALLGLTPQAANMSIDATTTSDAILANPTDSKWLTYTNLLPAGAFPGNAYSHGSLLAPASNDNAGNLGTALLQTDAITYLVINTQP